MKYKSDGKERGHVPRSKKGSSRTAIKILSFSKKKDEISKRMGFLDLIINIIRENQTNVKYKKNMKKIR